jgi:hypothetical protein
VLGAPDPARAGPHHNQSIFGKIRVSTRGAAALFAREKGLV